MSLSVKMSPQEIELSECVREAALLLTPAGHRGKPNDAWRLDRARWLYQYHDQEIAEAELKDMNDLRALYRWEGKSGYDEIPKYALNDPVGSDIPSAAGGPT